MTMPYIKDRSGSIPHGAEFCGMAICDTQMLEYRKRKRCCKVCHKKLSGFNDGKYCFVHQLEGTKREDAKTQHEHNEDVKRYKKNLKKPKGKNYLSHLKKEVAK